MATDRQPSVSSMSFDAELANELLAVRKHFKRALETHDVYRDFDEAANSLVIAYALARVVKY